MLVLLLAYNIFMLDNTVERTDKLSSPLSMTKDSGHVLLWLRVGASNRVLDYGDRSEIISDSDLFDEDSLKSLVGCPVCLQHPPSFFLGGKTPKDYIDGVVLQGFEIEHHDGDKYLTVPAIIFDSNAIDAIDDGTAVEISPGYTCFVEKSDTGEIYQKHRRYDHIALVTQGRTGADVKIKLDENVMETEINKEDTTVTTQALRRFLIDNAECFQGLPDLTLDRIDSIDKAREMWLSQMLPIELKSIELNGSGLVQVVKYYQNIELKNDAKLEELTTQNATLQQIVSQQQSAIDSAVGTANTDSPRSTLGEIQICKTDDHTDIVAIARTNYAKRVFNIGA